MKNNKNFSLILICPLILIAIVLFSTPVNYYVAATTSSNSSMSFVSNTNSPNASQLKMRSQAVSSMSNLFGFDMSKYNVTLTGDYSLSAQMFPQYGGLSPENVQYNLTSVDGNIVNEEVEFLNGSAIHYQLYYYGNATNNLATPNYLQPTPLTLSQKVITFLTRYQNFSRASYIQPMLDLVRNNSLDEMLSTLNISNATNSASVINNNLKMEVSANEYSTEILFMPSYGGADYPNGINLDILNNGNIDTFTDQQSLYSIGSTTINVSKDDAINTAWNAANNISTVSIDGVGNVSIHFMNNPMINLYGSVRDNMKAYPFYFIQIPTDKVYYTVDGVQVGIWADTGQVAFCELTGFEGQPIPNGQVQTNSVTTPSPLPISTQSTGSMNNSFSSMQLFIITVISVAIVAITIAAIVVKRRH